MRTSLVIAALCCLACTGTATPDGTARRTAGGLSFEAPPDWSLQDQAAVQEGVRLNVVVLQAPRHSQVRLHHFRAPMPWTSTSFTRHLLESQPTFVPNVKARYRTGTDTTQRVMLGALRTGTRIPLVLTPGPADLPYHAEVFSFQVDGHQLVTYHQLPGVPDPAVEAAIDRIYETLTVVDE